MTTVEGTPCACRFNGNGERLQECGEHAASRARLREAEDRCDEHVAHVLEVADVLDAADGETAAEAARRQMEWRRQGLQVLCESSEALQEHAQLGESAADCIRRLAARVAELEQQVAALADALAGLTASICRCYEHNDALGDAMDLAKVVLRATGRKP